MKSILSKLCKTGYIYLFISSIIAAVVCFLNLGTKSFWVDEVHSINLASNLSFMFSTAWHETPNMLFYYFLLHFWLKLGNSEFVVRSFSAIFAVLTIIPMYLLGKKLFNHKVGLIAALLLSVNGFFVEYAQEVRSYSLLIFLIVISTYFLVSLEKKFNKKNYVLYVLITALAIYTQFFAIFFVLSQAVYVLIRNRGEILNKKFLLQFLSVGFLTLPLLFFPSFSHQGNLGWVGPVSLADGIDLFIQLSGGFYTGLFSLLFIFISIYFLQKKKLKFGNEFTLTLILLCLPIILTFFISIYIKPIYVQRYLIICLPFFILLISYFLSFLYSKRVYFLIIFIFLILSFLNIHQVYYGFSFAKEDWRDATSYVLSNYEPHDTVLFYAYFVRGPFEYYKNNSSEKNKVVSMPELSMAYYSSGGGTVLPEPNLKLIDKLNSRIWLVLSHESGVDLRDRQRTEILNKILSEYQLVRTVEYKGISVLLFKR